MRVTTKEQVRIPQHIREKLGIVPATDIELVEEKEPVRQPKGCFLGNNFCETG